MQLRFRNFNLKCDSAWLLMALLCAFVRAALQLAPAPSRAGVIMYCKLAIIWVMLWDTFEPYVLCRLCHEVERTGWRVGETLLENCWSFVANFFVFYDWEKLSVPLKVVVMLLCCRGLLRPFLQQNWHMQLLRVCKQLMENNRLVLVRISQWVWFVYHRNVYARLFSIGSFFYVKTNLGSQNGYYFNLIWQEKKIST